MARKEDCLFGTVVKRKSLESKLYDKLIYLKITTFSFVLTPVGRIYLLGLHATSNSFMASLLSERRKNKNKF